jgi:hypothetical protein
MTDFCPFLNVLSAQLSALFNKILGRKDENLEDKE